MGPSSLRVLHIIDSGGFYGAESVLLNLMAEQVKMGLKPAIASIGERHIKGKPLEVEAVRRGLKIKTFRMRPGPNLIGALQILRFAHKEGFDLLHSHGYKGNILFGFLPKRIRKIPLVTTLHGWTSSDSLTRMKLYEWLDGFSLKFIDAVVLVNKAMLSNPGVKNRKGIRMHVINNGIPAPNSATVFSPTQQSRSTRQFDRSIIEFCRKGPTIGSIGRLSEEKGYRYLIEALHLLIQKGIDSNLIILGEGNERRCLEQLIEKFKLTERVLMPGYRAAARDYLPCLDVFVLSSLTEGLPITLLEAMQAKVPIVATKVGGVPDVIENGKDGLFVESRDPEKLSDAISRIYHNSELRDKLISCAYKKVMTDYTTEKMAMRYLEVYRKLCMANQTY